MVSTHMRTLCIFLMPFLLLLNSCGNNGEAASSQNSSTPATKPVPETPSTAMALGDDEKPKPKDPLGSLFELGSSLAKSADEIGQAMFGLTEKEQKEIGQRLHRKIKAKHGLKNDSAPLARIKKLAAPFLKQMKRKDLAVSFYVLNSDEVNAFSHVGGHIYLNKGLLEIIETDAELQFVLGHEIAHLELGHCEKLLTYAVRAKGLGDELGGTLGAEAAEAIAGLAYQALSAGYSEEQELACDAWAFHPMRKNGCTHPECTAMIRKFMEREKGKTEEKSEDRLSEAINNHFRTHPPATKRLEALKKLK